VKVSSFRAVTGLVGAVVLSTATVGLAGPAGAATASATSTSSTPADQRCAKPLPAPVIGDPGVHAGQASGARVWHDRSGWHVRFTHPGDGTQVFTGVIRSGQPISVRGYRLEKQDSYRLSNRGRTLTFRLVNHGQVDGLDFTDRCAINTTFDLVRDGHRLAPADIHLGVNKAHPTSNPFRVQRHK
jgi:hypothetical protein